MSNSKKLATAALAGLLTASIMGTAVVAQANENDGNGAKMEKSSSIVVAANDKHACKGLNSCKGQGADGKNDCKGKGSCRTDGGSN